MPASLPAAFSAALASDHVRPDHWIEIEGLPWSFGIVDRAASWFASRPAEQRRLGVVGVLLALPRGAEQEARPLDAESSIGQVTVQLQMDETTVLPLISGGARRDGQVSLSSPDRLNLHAYGVNETIRFPNGTGGAWNIYLCYGAGTSASAIPPAGTNDPLIADGSVGWSLLGPEDMDASTTPNGIGFTGSAAAFPASGVLYLGRETVAYSSKLQGAGSGAFAGLTRGQFALPGLELKAAHTAGDLLSPYPRFIATRRVAWYATLDASDENRITRWSGTVRGAKLLSGATGLELSFQSLEGDLLAKVFGTQRTGKLAKGLAAGDGAYMAQDDTEPAAEPLRLVLAKDSTSGTWTAGAEILLRIGDEYIAGTVAVDGIETSITVLGRGCFSSQPVQHSPGEDVLEVIWTGARNALGTSADQVSRFTVGDHPFDVALAFLCSRLGDGANGVHDVLPEGWGLGIDASRIDLTGIAAVRRTWFPAARHLWVYEEPFALKATLTALLRPHACYPVTTLGDLLTFRRLSPPIPGTTLRQLDADGIVAVPTWDAAIADVVGRVIWTCDYDPISGDPRQSYKGELSGPGTEAQEFYAGQWRTLEVEARGSFTGNDVQGTRYFGSGLTTDADGASQRYFEMVRDRYARPFPVLGVECSYDHLDVEVGDLVTLTVENLPDVTTGALGLDGAICEVLRRSIDDVRGVVALTLLHSTSPASFRLLSPSGVALSVGASSITLTDGLFNDADQDATAGFYAGQVIEIWSPDLKTLRTTATIASVSAGTLSTGVLGVGPVAGDVVVLAGYGAQPALEQARDASLASTAELLDGTDPAHAYAT